MNKSLALAAVLAALSFSAAAASWIDYNGVPVGTVCRNGNYYTDYSGVGYQPVGSACWVRQGGNPWGSIILAGRVTSE